MEKLGNGVFSFVATKSTRSEIISVNYGFRMMMQTRSKIVVAMFEDFESNSKYKIINMPNTTNVPVLT